MLIRKCDRCKAEIEEDARRVRVQITEGGKVYRDGTSKEEIYDLCENCRMQLHDFFHQVEITPTSLFSSNVITGIVEKEKKEEENFWDTHDPSGGDLPPEDDEEESVGSTEKETKKPEKQQDNKKRSGRVDHGKICALRKAGWPVKEICSEMHISAATVFKHLKMEKLNEKN